MNTLLEVQIEQVSYLKVVIRLLKKYHNNVTIEFVRDDPTNSFDKLCHWSQESKLAQNACEMNLSDQSDDEIENDFPQKRKATINTNTQNKKAKMSPLNTGYLKIRTYDQSQSLFTNLKVKLRSFYCKSDSYNINMNMTQLHTLFNSQPHHKDSMLTILVSENNADHVAFTFVSPTYSQSVSIKQVVIDKQTVTIPSPITFDTVMQIDGTKFKQLCYGMKNISDTMHIKVTSNNATFMCHNSDDGITQIATFVTGDFLKLKFNDDNVGRNCSVEGKFNLQCLSLLASCEVLTIDLQIFLKNDH